ncbi:threonine/homoserine/homoserine lactone efflux protein [Ureibacillus acetophenoni]|uniref:Threonine/homoserine/homoserine lactone efflux protein n=2 Tax=Ureibacillus acetophenoni TaxID=614649 RepID=A0A285U571_9BACL|nr:threonine/homoserine/homoserine lactone efflux protein [Ureibacillus acetophenoni]
MPVGAITVEMTKQGLKNGFLHGWAVGLGGITIDLTLIILLSAGLASILALPIIQIPMWLIGAAFLLFLGYDSIINADKDITLSGEKVKKSFFSSFKNGVLVAVSPGNLVFWVNVFGVVLAKNYASDQSHFIIVALGILSGILLHDLGLLSIISITRKALSRKAIKWLTIISGILLICFAGYFVYEFIQSVKVYI